LTRGFRGLDQFAGPTRGGAIHYDLEIIAVYAILSVTVVLFVTDKLRPDIVGVSILSVLGLCGLIEPEDLLKGFGNEAVVTIAAMFVLNVVLMFLCARSTSSRPAVEKKASIGSNVPLPNPDFVAK